MSKFRKGDRVNVTLNFNGPHEVVVGEPDSDGDIILRAPDGRYEFAGQVHCTIVMPTTALTVELTDAEVTAVSAFTRDVIGSLFGDTTTDALMKLARAGSDSDPF